MEDQFPRPGFQKVQYVSNAAVNASDPSGLVMWTLPPGAKPESEFEIGLFVSGFANPIGPLGGGLLTGLRGGWRNVTKFFGFADDAARGGSNCVPSAANSIATRYAVETQCASEQAQAALAQAQNGGTLFRAGQLGKSMAGESQYWSMQNPLAPGYAGRMGMPAVRSDFIMGGSLNPSASVLTNTAGPLAGNSGGGIQVITSPGGVVIQWFVMP